ncbi:hypothetical protein [Ornithinimicrobium cavernae]|uniref:hypothetical protein n=1 Tax=Ornithinimicrobium cavernae TaxID=2666047 RepID=UPI0012B17A4B|nr:hypothetical protein [Ornithinimicrobium cavernae]
MLIPRVLVGSAALYGLIAASGFIGPWWALPLSWFVWGVIFGPESVMTDTYVARTTPDRTLGRTYAMWSIIARAGAALAYILVLIASEMNPDTLATSTAIALTLVVPPTLTLILRHTSP